uniref:alpha/beta hydrolase domain-containing protein n=1 Tax=Sphingomonas sp. TaxID=28214 RepID=UPI003B3AB48E
MKRTRALLLMIAIFAPGAAKARLTEFLVEQRIDIAATGKIPAYVILRGHYRGALRPSDPHNVIITDLDRADRLADGRVGYRATFAIAMPRDPARDSGFLLYDVPNRGNGDVAPDSEGHVRAVSGWQGDIAPTAGLQTLEVPIARRADGGPITGPVLQRFTAIEPGANTIAIVGGLGRPTPRPLPVTLDTAAARLFRQASDRAAPIDIAAGDWAFADCRTRPFPGTPDPTRLCVRGGFVADQAYTIVYQGKDPQVLGIGFAAVRDLNAFLRYARQDDAGHANPLAQRVRWSIVSGTSQSGNFVRSLIALGFNAAEDGRQVFDGAAPNIAARQVPLNVRFGVPGGAADLYEPGSEGALWWSRYDDRARRRGTSSLLDRCHVSRTCPRIVETFGSAEFWGLRISPDLVGTDARRDLPLPAEVRRYYFPGVTHNGSPTGGFPLGGDAVPKAADFCTLAWNPNPSSDTMRALLKALRDWVSSDKEPPPSRYPTLAQGDLVPPTARAMGWPAIP